MKILPSTQEVTVSVPPVRRRRPSRATAALLAATLASALPSALHAQGIARVASAAPRVELGIGLEYAEPIGQFRQNVTHGFGGGGHVGYRIDPAGVLTLRADVSYLNYGSQSSYIPYSSFYGTTTLQEKTSNNILAATVGPQLALPVGPVRPYVNGGIGFAYFYTQTSLQDYYTGQSLAQRTNYSDNSLMYTGGGGVTIPLAMLGQTVALDVGATYHAVGSTRYLTKGDIAADPNSPTGVIITPHQSDARFMTYHLGIALAF